MSPNTLTTLVITSILAVGAFAVIAICIHRRERTWTAATEGRYAPVLAQFLTVTALGAVLLRCALHPPLPIDWDSPIPCSAETACGAHYYYVLTVIIVAVLAVAGLLLGTVLCLALFKAVLVRGGAKRSTLAMIVVGALAVVAAVVFPPSAPRSVPAGQDLRQDLRHPAGEPPPALVSDVTPAGTAPMYPPTTSLQRACGGFTLVEKLTQHALRPEPAPGQPVPQPDGRALIDDANALNLVDDSGLPTPVNAAVRAHTSALTALGAMINAHARQADISAVVTVVDATAAVLQELCAA